MSVSPPSNSNTLLRTRSQKSKWTRSGGWRMHRNSSGNDCSIYSCPLSYLVETMDYGKEVGFEGEASKKKHFERRWRNGGSIEVFSARRWGKVVRSNLRIDEPIGKAKCFPHGLLKENFNVQKSHIEYLSDAYSSETAITFAKVCKYLRVSCQSLISNSWRRYWHFIGFRVGLYTSGLNSNLRESDNVIPQGTEYVLLVHRNKLSRLNINA